MSRGRGQQLRVVVFSLMTGRAYRYHLFFVDRVRSTYCNSFSLSLFSVECATRRMSWMYIDVRNMRLFLVGCFAVADDALTRETATMAAELMDARPAKRKSVLLRFPRAHNLGITLPTGRISFLGKRTMGAIPTGGDKTSPR